MRKFNFNKIFELLDGGKNNLSSKPFSLNSKVRDWRIAYGSFLFIFALVVVFSMHMFYRAASEDADVEMAENTEQTQTIDRDALRQKLLDFERIEAEFNHLHQEPPVTTDPSL